MTNYKSNGRFGFSVNNLDHFKDKTKIISTQTCELYLEDKTAWIVLDNKRKDFNQFSQEFLSDLHHVNFNFF